MKMSIVYYPAGNLKDALYLVDGEEGIVLAENDVFGTQVQLFTHKPDETFNKEMIEIMVVEDVEIIEDGYFEMDEIEDAEEFVRSLYEEYINDSAVNDYIGMDVDEEKSMEVLNIEDRETEIESAFEDLITVLAYQNNPEIKSGTFEFREFVETVIELYNNKTKSPFYRPSYVKTDDDLIYYTDYPYEDFDVKKEEKENG